MISQQFYHETIRKIVVAFGTMFNNITIIRKDANGNVIQSMKVPLAYGPKKKFLVRLQEDPNLDKAVSITLPRLGFEISGLEYDSARKLNRIQKRKTVGTDDDKINMHYMPVPYNINFDLFAMAKNSDDALQIVEQILPYFQPEYSVTVNDLPEFDNKTDVPIVLNSISYEDLYEGDFAERQTLMYTLSFTAKFYLYGPITSQSVIKEIQVDQYTDLQPAQPAREQRYGVAPDPATAEVDDDFGFSETTGFFEDAKTYDPETGQDT